MVNAKLRTVASLNEKPQSVILHTILYEPYTGGANADQVPEA